MSRTHDGLVDWMAMSMKLDCRDVQALLRLRERLRAHMDDDLFLLGLNVAAAERAKTLQAQSFEATTPQSEAMLAGGARHVRELPKMLVDLIQRLDEIERNFAQEMAGQQPSIPTGHILHTCPRCNQRVSTVELQGGAPGYCVRCTPGGGLTF